MEHSNAHTGREWYIKAIQEIGKQHIHGSSSVTLDEIIEIHVGKEKELYEITVLRPWKIHYHLLFQMYLPLRRRMNN